MKVNVNHSLSIGGYSFSFGKSFDIETIVPGMTLIDNDMGQEVVINIARGELREVDIYVYPAQSKAQSYNSWYIDVRERMRFGAPWSKESLLHFVDSHKKANWVLKHPEDVDRMLEFISNMIPDLG